MNTGNNILIGGATAGDENGELIVSESGLVYTTGSIQLGARGANSGIVVQTGGSVSTPYVWFGNNTTLGGSGIYSLDGGNLTIGLSGLYVSNTSTGVNAVFNFNGGTLNTSTNTVVADATTKGSGNSLTIALNATAPINTAGNSVTINNAMTGSGCAVETGPRNVRPVGNADNNFSGGISVNRELAADRDRGSGVWQRRVDQYRRHLESQREQRTALTLSTAPALSISWAMAAISR